MNRRVVTFALLGLTCVGVQTGAAAADTSGQLLGPVAISPANGFDNDLLTFSTNGVCPAPATNLLVSLRGPGIDPDAAGLVGNSSASIYLPDPRGRSYVIPSGDTLQEMANKQPAVTTLNGTYEVVVKCIRVAGATVYGRYEGTIRVADRKYVSVPNAAALAASPPPIASTATPPGVASGLAAPTPTSAGGRGGPQAPSALGSKGSPLPAGSQALASGASLPTNGSLTSGPNATAAPKTGAQAVGSRTSRGSGTPAWVVALVVIAALWLCGGLAAFVFRRRRAHEPPQL